MTPHIIPDRDRYRKYYLDEDVHHTLHNGDTLMIRKGFRFDAHSVPFPFHFILPKYCEKDVYCALIHDYLVDTEPWHRYNRRFIDKEYTILMNKYSTGLRRFLMPLAVRFYGFWVFDIWGDYRGEPKPNTRIDVKVTHGEVV